MTSLTVYNHVLSPVPPNSGVWITSGDIPVHGTVVSTADTPRSYEIETPSGRVRRNRQHLNAVPENQGLTNQPQARTRDPILTHSRT